jgi:hypothetical protein
VTDEQRPDARDAPERGATEPAEPEPDWVRRRRLAAVFGDVLPEATGDDAAEAGAESPAEDTRNEEWLRRQVPPHHG